MISPIGTAEMNGPPPDSATRKKEMFVMPQWFYSQNSWVEHPVQSNNLAYSYPILLRLQGTLAPDALERSLQEVVNRHQVFRAVFELAKGEMIAHIRPHIPLKLAVTDLGETAEQEARAHSLILEELAQPFDLRRDLLLRAKLLRLAPEDHLLLVNTHHIVCDDWSSGILLRDLGNYYTDFAAGEGLSSPALSYQYADFVRWLSAREDSEKATLSFWKENLSGSRDFYHLPCDLPRPARQTIRGAHERVFFPEALLNSLKTLSQQERVSLFMTMLSGFKCLLHSYSGDEIIGVGSCVAHRPLTEVEEVIGPFGNVIVIQTKLSGNPTYRELLHRVRESSLNCLSRQDLPFGRLVRAFEPHLPVDRNPLFQTLFVFENAPREKCQFPDLTVSRLPLETQTTRYELNLWVRIGREFEVELQYNSHLFQKETIKQMLSDYERVLKRMTSNPGAKLANVSIPRRPARAPRLAETSKTMAKDGAEPADNVQYRLLEIWQAAFKDRVIGPDQNFFELGGDSLLGARLFAQIEKTFQVQLPLAALLEAPTVRQLAEIIGGRKAQSSDSVVVVQPHGTKPPLFCVYGHGGGIFYFGILSRWLGADQPIYGLRLEGFGKDQSNSAVEDFAAYFLREIRQIQPTGPYCLTGYCFAGMIAYEMARLLKAGGEEVAFLALFNTPSPGSLKGWPLSPHLVAKRTRHELRKFRLLRNKEKVKVFALKSIALAKLVWRSLVRFFWRALPQPSTAAAGEGARRFLSLGNVSVLAAKAYRPAPYSGRVSLFLTEEVGSRYAIDPVHGWHEFAAEGVELFSIEGDNVSFFESGHVEALAETLRSCLARVPGDSERSRHDSAASVEREMAAGKVKIDPA